VGLERAPGLGRLRRALAVVAHPDDESFGLGAVLAHLVTRGVSVSLLCFTHGEASTLGASTTGRDDLGVRRAAELRKAADQLGLDEVALLDYPDDELVTIPTGELDAHVEAHVQAIMAAQPHEPPALVAFERGGVTGHLDHRAATAAAWRVASRRGLPLLEWTVAPEVADALNAELGTSFASFMPGAAPIALHVDRSVQARAVACHASQVAGNAVLARRLELQGGVELVRWLTPAGAEAP